MKKFKAGGAPTAYTENTPIDAYILARAGLTDNAVAEALGVRLAVFQAWVRKHEPLAYAMSRARKLDADSASGTYTFAEYVYDQLPAKLRELWDEIESFEGEEDQLERVRALLNTKPTRMIQHLWVHALISSNFNASVACRKVGITFDAYQQWLKRDPYFPKLVDQINWHKKNFFEGALIDLVKQGNTLATIFTNKTFNKDRGYDSKVTVEHTGTVNVNLGVVMSVDQLKLPLEVRKQIREALRVTQVNGIDVETMPLSPDSITKKIPLELIDPDDVEKEE